MSIIQEEKNTFYIATSIYFQESKIKMNKKTYREYENVIYYLHVWLVASDILVSKGCRALHQLENYSRQ